jgi:hypothetical protein
MCAIDPLAVGKQHLDLLALPGQRVMGIDDASRPGVWYHRRGAGFRNGPGCLRNWFQQSRGHGIQSQRDQRAAFSCLGPADRLGAIQSTRSLD